MTREQIYAKGEELYNALKANDIYADIYPYRNDMPVIVAEIDGDWKHDHWAADEIAKENGFTLLKQEIIRDTMSDWYPARHYYITHA